MEMGSYRFVNLKMRCCIKFSKHFRDVGFFGVLYFPFYRESSTKGTNDKLLLEGGGRGNGTLSYAVTTTGPLEIM